MVGGLGFIRTSVDRFEDLSSLKINLRQSHTVEQIHFMANVATGGGGAVIRPGEATGSVISDEDAEAQVYIRASAGAAGYNGDGCTLTYMGDDGVIRTPITQAFTAGGATDTEIAVAGADDFFRVRPGGFVSNTTPAGGHHFTLGDADHNPNGAGADVWAMIEENNYNNIDGYYFVPTADAAGNTMVAYLGGIYVTSYPVKEESCSIRLTCTPYGATQSATVDFKLNGMGGDGVVFEHPFKLKGATDLQISPVDDGNTGATISLEWIVIEGTKKPQNA